MHSLLSNHRAGRLGVVAVAWLLACGLAHAEWPDRPVHLVVPYVPGGGVDNIARIVAPALGKQLGQPVIIDNKPGANANIGSEFVAKAPPDGYTFLVGATYLGANRASMSGLGYDSLKDLAPVSRLGRSPSLLVVSASLPVHSVQELIAYGKTHASEVSYATVGTVNPNQLIFGRNTGIPAVAVLYKGGGQALPDLIAGRVTFMLTVVSEVLPNIQGGKLRALAVTGTERLKSLPDVPTMDEAGVANLTSTGWWGVFSPTRTAPAIDQRMSAAIGQVMQQPDVVSAMAQLGIQASFLDASAFADFYRSEIAFYDDTAKTFDLRQK